MASNTKDAQVQAGIPSATQPVLYRWSMPVPMQGGDVGRRVPKIPPECLTLRPVFSATSGLGVKSSRGAFPHVTMFGGY